MSQEVLICPQDVYPKKTIPKFQIHRDPSPNHVTAILISNCGYNAAKGLSICVFVPACVF